MEEKPDCEKNNIIKLERKELFLKFLAWLIKPFSPDDEVYRICRKGLMSIAEVDALVKEIEAEGLIISVPAEHRMDIKYIMKPDLQLKLLTEIKKSKNKSFFAGFTGYYPSNWRREEWTASIQEYILGKKKEKDMPFYADIETIRYLVMWMPCHPDWLPFFYNFSPLTIMGLYDGYKEVWGESLMRPNMTCLTNGYFENKTLSAETREKYKTDFGIYQYVYSGRLNEIPTKIPADIPEGMCLHAVYHQYKGDISETLELYTKALKGMSLKFFDNALLNLYYTIALINDSTAESKKKMETMFKRDYVPSELLPAQILGLYALNEKLDKSLNYIRYGYKDLAPLEQVLVSLIINHFHLDNKIKIKDEKIHEILNDDNLKLLQLECSEDFLPYTNQAESLKKELGLSPILPPYHKVNEWERVLALLMEKAKQNPQKEKEKKTKAESQGRIIYRIDQYRNINPYLQKSKDGIVWSKGRAISLSAFQEGIPEMNEIDRTLTTYVKRLTGSWSDKERWQFSGPKPLMILAGYPLVFSDEKPDKPVKIQKEEPEVIVTKVKDGFKVEGNVEPFYIDGNYMVKRENDFLIRIMELSLFQRDIMIAINRVHTFPKQAEKQLTELLQELSKSITVHSDLIKKNEELEQKNAETRITIQLQPMGEGFKAELFIKPFAGQPTYCKAGKGAISVIDNIDGQRVQALRDLATEKKHLEETLEWLQPVMDNYNESEDIFYFQDADQCLCLLDILCEHANDVNIEWPEGTKLSIKGKADFKNLNLAVKGIGQWFEVTGELKIDATALISIAGLLQKIRESKGHFISLSGTEFISISEKLRKQLLAMDALLTQEKEKLQLPTLAIERLQEMEGLGINLKKDSKFKSMIERIETATSQDFPLPKKLQAELKDYQIDGFRWMSRLAHWGAGACLADDMGVGKTLQAIAFMLAHGAEGPSLVVAPAAVILNWKQELERFAPSLTPILMHETGCDDRRSLTEQASPFDVVLITYGLLGNEIDVLADKEWNAIVLDEAHNIKNKDTKMSKAAMQLKGNFRLLLTGTPLQNHLAEIWNLFQFANPGLLGSFAQFNEKFIQPIEKCGDKDRQRLLKKLISPFILRRTKADVLEELPEKTETTLRIVLNEKEQALYENLRRKVVNDLEEGSTSAIKALAEITQLRQAACHPALVDSCLDIPSSKSEVFIRLARELMKNNHRALVFSQFTSHLALIQKELKKEGIDYLYLDGSMTPEERNKLVKTFQTGDQPLFLISLKAGGTGLNLTAADFVIHLDPWWNPAIEDQASDRAYRIGQTRPVTVYRLIAAQTIEEKIIKLHQSKKSLADSLLEGSDLSHKLTKEEMLELLKSVN
jgi:superfamily II DNA or RNA helicase